MGAAIGTPATNLHSPGPIGDVTPSTGEFTTLRASGNCDFAGCFIPRSDGIFVQQNILIQAEHTLAFEGGFSNTGDLFLVRAAANTFAQRNGTNGQTWIVSRTFTDASNYSQFSTVVTGTTVAFTIAEAGTGVGGLTGYTFDKPVTAGANAIKGLITTNANATTGLVAGALAALTNASIVIYDGTGTAYRVPCTTP